MDLKDHEIIGLISDIFNKSGINGYLVGGAVRDIILGVKPTDFDFAAEVNERMHAEAAYKIADILGCELIYNNYYHTAKFSYSELDIDFVMARKEFYKGIASRPEVKASNIRDDLARRDFTINSIAASLDKKRYGDLVDPFSGVEDIGGKKIRLLHPKSFMDDPTRIFRGIKYAARFKFDCDVITDELIYEGVSSNYLGYLSPARLKQELTDILNEANAAEGLRLIDKYNVLGSLAGCSVKINYGFNTDEFRRLNTNGRLAIVLCDNDLETLNALKEKLDLGNRIIQNINRIHTDRRGLE